MKKIKKIVESVTTEYNRTFILPGEMSHIKGYYKSEYEKMARMSFAHEILHHIEEEEKPLKSGLIEYTLTFRCIHERNFPFLYRRVKRILEKEPHTNPIYDIDVDELSKGKSCPKCGSLHYIVSQLRDYNWEFKNGKVVRTWIDPPDDGHPKFFVCFNCGFKWEPKEKEE